MVVVGGGAAGIIAAWRAHSLGAPLVLLEKTDRLGTKILISGGGKCNVTHAGPVESVLKAFKREEAVFLRPSFYRFPPTEIVQMLADRGLQLYTRDDGRMFPLDADAKDVVACLSHYLTGVDVRMETPVTGIEPGRGVWIGETLLETDHVVLCVGGSSFPKTGTTGDGYAWARSLGHQVVPVRAALAPVEFEGVLSDPNAGVSLRDVLLRARQSGKVIDKWRGDVLFTHRGLSGPAVLGITRSVAEEWDKGPVDLEVDLAPDTPFETLQTDLATWKQHNPNAKLAHALEEFVPSKLVARLLDSAHIHPETSAQRLAKKEANKLVETLKSWRLGRVSKVLFDKGEVVAGGVSLDEVDPKTMRSQKIGGLYLAGEILDIAGPVGGYNLQAAWSTGYVAGESAAQDWLATRV